MPSMISRRELLRVGSLGLMGVTLPRLLAADEVRGAGDTVAKADACVLSFLNGGPSHLDMWDTHAGSFAKLKTTLLPQFDTACTSLVEELAERQGRSFAERKTTLHHPSGNRLPTSCPFPRPAICPAFDKKS